MNGQIKARLIWIDQTGKKRSLRLDYDAAEERALELHCEGAAWVCVKVNGQTVAEFIG